MAWIGTLTMDAKGSFMLSNELVTLSFQPYLLVLWKTNLEPFILYLHELNQGREKSISFFFQASYKYSWGFFHQSFGKGLLMFLLFLFSLPNSCKLLILGSKILFFILLILSPQGSELLVHLSHFRVASSRSGGSLQFSNPNLVLFGS